MRIIGGIFRSRKIDFPLSKDVRPTKDRVKEAVFSIIGDIKDFTVLDLFAGSGSYGLESLSRGASYVSFVDNNDISIKCIKHNVGQLGVTNICEIIKSDYLNSLLRFQCEKKSFNLVFLDPPYKMDIYKEVIEFLKSNSLLYDKYIIICESNHSFGNKLDEFGRTKEYKYKDTYINVVRN